MTSEYSKEAIEKFAAWVDDDPDALEWLIAFEYTELVLLREATLGDTKATAALLKRKHFILAAFANAIWDDADAMRVLILK